MTSDAGPCGAAALTKSQVIVTDIESDPRFQSATIRPLSARARLRSHWSTPIYSRDGTVLGTFAIFQRTASSPTELQQDLIAQVTHIASIAIERAQADEALRSSERNLSLTINTIPIFISVARPDGTILSVNQAALDYHGITLQDVQKEDFRTRFFHPDDAERVREERKEALKYPLQFEYETRALGKDGKYRWFLVRCNPLLDDQGRIDRWYAIAFDIEDRKRAEAQRDRTIEELQAQQLLLSESEQRFRTIFDEAGAGIALVDLQQPDSHIQTNRALQTMLSLTQEELGFPETYDELTASENRKADAATYRELCEGKRNSLRLEKHFVLQDGSSVFANVIFTLLRDSAGLPRFIVAIHEDITERKRALERLQEKQELLDLAQKSARAMAFDWYVQQERQLLVARAGSPVRLAARQLRRDIPELEEIDLPAGLAFTSQSNQARTGNRRSGGRVSCQMARRQSPLAGDEWPDVFR